MNEQPKRILLVEDEADLRGLIAAELVSLGYHVDQAVDGQQALNIVRESHPDVIISDVVMPNKSGSDLLKELRKTDFGKKIPFIVLTAHGNMKDYFDIVHVDGFVEKPFKVQELVDAIRSVLGRAGVEARSVAGYVAIPSEKKNLDSVPARNIDRSETITSVAEGYLDIQMSHAIEGAVSIPAEKTAKSYKVLVVEDDSRMANALEQVLFKSGCLVRMTTTAARCIEESVNYAPDVVFMKSIVSGLSADAIVGLLRGMFSLRHLPVVVYGGSELGVLKKSLLKHENLSVIMDKQTERLIPLIEKFVLGMFRK
ncbi:MAG TPA: response regulator [Candidatus Omnitrophota bacterium]|nr:response regulator [Candidatus Omnitrophota bacterium]